MKVSIIIPIYSVERYVERCVRSVMAQTYSDIECILVDDCTPDGSIAICERLISEYEGPIQFTILHHEFNRGASAARNTGTDAATGEYVYYLDSDDEITPNCISLMAAEVENHPRVEMVVGAVKSVPSGTWVETISCHNKSQYIDNPFWAAYMFNKHEEDFLVCAWNKLTSINFLKRYNISFKEGLMCGEDQLWTHLTTQYISSVSVIANRTYTYYAKTAGSIMNAMSDIDRARYLSLVFCNVVDTLKMDYPLSMLQFYKAYTTYLLGWYNCLSKHDYQEARRSACCFLLRKRKYLTAFYTHLFFKWNLALGLRKYQPQLERYIMRRYLREEALAARLCGMEL